MGVNEQLYNPAYLVPVFMEQKAKRTQSGSGGFRDDKNFLPLGVIEPRCLGCQAFSLVSVLIETPWLHICVLKQI
jgi:hypothetical protein